MGSIMTDPQSDAPEQVEVAALLERRATIERWLARLDDYGTEVSARVTERVRGDYEARLREIGEQLSSREDAVRAELEARIQELTRAEDEHAGAREVLEETLLRQRIGELSPGEWDERRPLLETAVASALERLESLRAETARLETVLAEIVSPPVAFGTDEDDDIPLIDEFDGIPVVDLDAEPEPDPATPAPGNDLAFLEELDRAIAYPTLGGAGVPPSDAGSTAPRRGAKCPECGYTNDVGAWYCGVCGVDLA